MKKSYKIIVSALTFSMGLNLVGCNKPASTDTENSAAKSASQTQAVERLNEAAKTGAAVTGDNFTSSLPSTAPTYKVVTTGTMPPFSFSNEQGSLIGFDIDAMRAIGEAGGFKVEFYKAPFNGIFETVGSGKFDLGASGISYTEERKGLYNLSDSYFFNPSAIMYKSNGKPVNSLAELKGVKVAGMTGSKQIDQAKQATGEAQIDNYETNYLLFQALVQDKAQAIVQDEPFLRYTAKNFPEQKVTIVPYESQAEPSAQQIVLMKKGNDELTARVNKGIAAVKANGKLKAIEDKWFK